MLTNIDIYQKEMSEIMVSRSLKSKNEGVDKALDMLLRQITREDVLKWKGTKVWEGDFNQMRED